MVSSYDLMLILFVPMRSITHDRRSTIFEYLLQCVRIISLISHHETCIYNFLAELQVIILYQKLISKPTNVGIDLKREM